MASLRHMLSRLRFPPKCHLVAHNCEGGLSPVKPSSEKTHFDMVNRAIDLLNES